MIRENDPNLPLLRLAAEALGDLKDQFVFVGGCAAGLLLSDPAADDIRATTDVDVVVELASRVAYRQLGEKLERRGFKPDEKSTAICAWRYTQRPSGLQVKLDVMPTDSSILGFTNRWYPQAVASATEVYLSANLKIRLISGPCFLATKLEAFRSRGKRDYLMSHDLEDILIVLDGRPELPQEVNAAEQSVRKFVAAQLAELLDDGNFLNAVPGRLREEGRESIVIGRMRDICKAST